MHMVPGPAGCRSWSAGPNTAGRHGVLTTLMRRYARHQLQGEDRETWPRAGTSSDDELQASEPETDNSDRDVAAASCQCRLFLLCALTRTRGALSRRRDCYAPCNLHRCCTLVEVNIAVLDFPSLLVPTPLLFFSPVTASFATNLHHPCFLLL